MVLHGIQQWEYTSIDYEIHANEVANYMDKLVEALNQIGREGWEVINVSVAPSFQAFRYHLFGIAKRPN
jgi:hypothetical protein